jgi:hypothetical protein
MTTPLPPSIALAIRERISLLREAWHVDEVYAQPQSRDRSPIARDRTRGATSSPRFPAPHGDDLRQES